MIVNSLKSAIKKLLTSLSIDISNLLILYEKFTVRVALTFKWYLKRYIFRQIEGLNGKIPPKNEEVFRVLAVWESSGRMKWFQIGNQDKNIQTYYLPRSLFQPFWEFYLHSYLNREKKKGDYSLDHYLSGTYESQRKAVRCFFEYIIRYIFKVYTGDLMLLPKLNDDWSFDFIKAINNAGVAVAIDDRESSISPKRMETIPPKLKGYINFDFDLLNLHNENHRTFFRNSGIAESKMMVQGCPQSDYWSRRELWQNRAAIHPQLDENKIMLLYFSFGPDSYFSYYYPEEKRSWEHLLNDYHDILFELLKEFPDDLQIVYKTGAKTARDLFPGMAWYKKQYGEFMNPSNFLELNTQYSSFDLTTSCDIVLGFQTSGLIEAMFTDKPIVYGAWGDLYEDIKDYLHPLHQTQALFYADSKSRLRDQLVTLIENHGQYMPTDEEKAARISFREKYFSHADGTVSARILAAARQAAMEDRS